VPEISRFFGIVIRMFYDDHPPPHFHVEYEEFHARMTIDTLQFLKGSALPPRIRGFVLEWANDHQAELLANWHRARTSRVLLPIAPLE
jgi:hypothetical protein